MFYFQNFRSVGIKNMTKMVKCFMLSKFNFFLEMQKWHWDTKTDSEIITYFASYTFSSIKGQTTYFDPRMALASKPKVKGKVKVDTFKTALDILKDKNLSGKVVIVTGANSGIGKCTI